MRGISEPDWPAADAIVGNPPFLGDKKMRAELGDEYTDALRRQYTGRVPGGADFVTYWFEKARAQIEAGKTQRAGLVATNSIRGGASRRVLERIVATAPIFEAWSDEEWINNGAAVRVSLVCFGAPPVGRMSAALSAECEPPHAADNGLTASSALRPAMLDGQPVAAIHADLTAGHTDNLIDLTQAKRLPENAGVCFMGITKVGAFDIPGEIARRWLNRPNPHGKQNAKVVRPSWNGLDIARRPRDTWIVDFGTNTNEADASLFELPFAYISEHVRIERATNNREQYRRFWWRHGEPRPALRANLLPLTRYIATPEVSKHRVFAWLDTVVLPDKNLQVIARADDTTFGILHSRFHELWSLRMGTSLEDRPRYTPTTTFETFPFPAGLTPRDTAIPDPRRVKAKAIAAAAQQLDTLRANWLNPPEWVDWVRTQEEEQAGFPLRPVAKPGHEAELKKRTLTNLYNARPTWLAHAHRELDAAVAAAYGWSDYTPAMPDEEILRRLLALNLERAEIERQLEIGRKFMKENHTAMRNLAK